MTIFSLNILDTTVIQDGQATGAINEADMRSLTNSLTGLVPSVKTADYTATLADRNNVMLEMNSGSAHTFFIDTDANVNFDIGTVLHFRRAGAGTLAITATTPGTTSLRLASPRAATARAQWSDVTAHKRAANEWVLGGDLT